MRHKGYTNKCIYCGQYIDMNNRDCPVIIEATMRECNEILSLKNCEYELNTVIAKTTGSSRSSPYGDGSSSGSGYTDTCIVYILKKINLDAYIFPSTTKEEVEE